MQRTETVAFPHLERLFEAVFEAPETPLVCEEYSALDSPLRKFESASTLRGFAESERVSGKKLLGLAVHYPATKGFLQVRRVSLKPEKCKGATWRESINGWGIIQLQVTHLDSTAAEVRVAVNTEKRANAWAATYPEMGSPSRWDWKYVEQQARRLIRVLRSDA